VTEAIPSINDVIALTPVKAAAVTGRTRTRIFAAIKNKELTAVKDGRATIITAEELRRWIRSLPTTGRVPEVA
jgi:excisionase family DNA binding protein